MNTSTKNVQKYEPGDWIVHCYHGVGRIKAAERKHLADKETTYFRIKMVDSMIWIPIENMDDGQIRPLAEKKDFQRAIKVLSRQPGELDSNINIRRYHIDKVIAENRPITTARLVRDMWARQHDKGTMNEGERRSFRALSDRLTQEWAICMGIEIEEAQDLLDDFLQRSQNPTSEKVETDEAKQSKQPKNLLDPLTS